MTVTDELPAISRRLLGKCGDVPGRLRILSVSC
jgi:hypothetical protein